MRKFGIVLFLLLVSMPGIAQAEDFCGGFSSAPQCQKGPGGSNGFFDIDMDPRFNIDMDPRFNIDADPRFNIDADPRFNIKADPRFNPGAKPCDLGIGDNCSKQNGFNTPGEDYSYPQTFQPFSDEADLYPQPLQPLPQQPIAGLVTSGNVESTTENNSFPDYKVILGVGLLAYAFRNEIKALFIKS